MRMLWIMMLATAIGCDDADPCDEYVDYICDCHPEEDCSSLENTYSDADPDLQDQCVYALDEQQNEDDDNDHTCGGDTGG